MCYLTKATSVAIVKAVIQFTNYITRQDTLGSGRQADRPPQLNRVLEENPEQPILDCAKFNIETQTTRTNF